MTREQARKLVDRLRLKIITSDAHGIVLQRLVTSPFHGIGGQHASYATPERWRLYTGSGIAGHSSEFWLRRIPISHASVPLGPFRNQRQLEKALRAFRRGEFK